MLKVGIFGATGRVGRLLIEEILNSNHLNLSSIYVRNELQYSLPSSTMVTRDFEVFLQSSDVIVDFSSPEAHPAKMEIRIRMGAELYEELSKAVSGKLRQMELIPDVKLTKDQEKVQLLHK